jgi:hypothetical protein
MVSIIATSLRSSARINDSHLHSQKNIDPFEKLRLTVDLEQQQPDWFDDFSSVRLVGA